MTKFISKVHHKLVSNAEEVAKAKTSTREKKVDGLF